MNEVLSMIANGLVELDEWNQLFLLVIFICRRMETSKEHIDLMIFLRFGLLIRYIGLLQELTR